MKNLCAEMILIIFVLVLTVTGCRHQAAKQKLWDRTSRLPSPECNLSLTSPVNDWWEALPLGNGQLGALIWGSDNRLTVKLDRPDIWDERGHPLWKTDEFTWKTIQKYREAGNFKRIHEIFDDHYLDEPPTHVAIGKLELSLPEDAAAKTFNIDLAKAQAQINYQDGKVVKAIASATEPVIMMYVPGALEKFDIWAPGMNGTWDKRLRGYPDPVMGSDDDSRWYTQSLPEGLTFTVFAKRAMVKGDTIIAIAITSDQKDGKDTVAAARKRADQALKKGYANVLAKHQKYWTKFWGTSAVKVPELDILQHYYLTRYFVGSTSRPGFPSLATVSAIWTDDRMFPAFKNDLHWDLTQVQYQSYQAAGNFTEGSVLFDYFYDLLPVFRQYARSFYETDGAAVPSVMTWGGNPTTGWPQYTCSPTYAGWIGWLFYQHWRYTQDKDFLKERAYPWCAEIAEGWSGLLEPDENGILKLPLSTCAEVFHNTPRSWMKPNTNQDLDLMQVHLLGLVEMAEALGKKAEAKRWMKMANSLGRRHVDNESALMWSENEKVTFLDSHLSHSMSIHPFNMMTIEGTERDREIIAATAKRYDECYEQTFEQRQDWGSFSYPWMSSWRSRTGQTEDAYRYLSMFVKAFITRNGFNMNRSFDENVKGGFPEWYPPYGFFTLDGNILANQAVHDMLIQSWAPTIGKGEPGIIRIFPAIPEHWKDASFRDLRAEGGFKVSAIRKDGKTTYVRIEATVDGLLRLRDPWPGREVKWNLPNVIRDGKDYTVRMKRGQVLENRL